MELMLLLAAVTAFVSFITLFFAELFSIERTAILYITLRAVKRTNPVEWNKLKEEILVNPAGNEKKEINRVSIPFDGKEVLIQFIYIGNTRAFKVKIFEGWTIKSKSSNPFSDDFKSREALSIFTPLQKYIARKVIKEVDRKANAVLDARAL